MTEPSVKPGEIVNVRQLHSELETGRKTVLVKTINVEIVHLILPADETIPTHEAQGELILHCLKGRILVLALGKAVELTSDQLFYVSMNEPFSIRAFERASLIVTIVAPYQGGIVELIGNSDDA